MRVWDGWEARNEIGSQSECFALLGMPGLGVTGSGSGREGRAYRGSWAEQSVVARLATKSTRKATRITTTPPTVRRSQRSEVLRASNSGFPVITNVLNSSFTGPGKDCSDQGHKLVLCRSVMLRGVKDLKIFTYGFRERRFA
jgi:hypothetical protein